MEKITDICRGMLYEYKRSHAYIDRKELCFRMGDDAYAKLKIEFDNAAILVKKDPGATPELLGIQVLRAEDGRFITLEDLRAINSEHKEHGAAFIRVILPSE